MKILIVLAALGAVAHADPLTVEVKPATLAWRVKRPVDVTLRVVNTSRTKQTFKAMLCSWEDHWKTDDPSLTWEHWGCDKNYAAKVDLAPGTAYEKTLPMFATRDGAHVLKMAFTPEGGTPTWSAPVAITVAP